MAQAGLIEAYEATRDRLGGMPFDEFKNRVMHFSVYPMWVKGRICGAVLVDGKEVHACILPWAHGKWFGRRAARVLNEVIDAHGEATTHATTEAGRKFVEALGFVSDGEIYRSSKKWALNQSSAR